MDRLAHKQANRAKREHRVRTVIKNTTGLPRLSVHISNRQVVAQIIDDASGKTLVYESSLSSKAPKGSLTDKAAWVGEQVAVSAKKAKLAKVVFDRGGKQYHGRVKALAEAARAGGMEF